MNKTIAVILGVFLLAIPAFAKAGIFGSSYEGCVEPSDDMAGYILEKASGTNLTKTNIEHALELVPAGIEYVSYGDIFKWLKVTENATECFTKRDYLDGLKILGKHTGEFAALTTLEGAASLVAPGLFLPGTLFKWYIDTLVKTLATNGFNDQITLYIAAMEKCKEEGMTRDFCQQEIKSGNYSFAYFHPTGFLVAVDSPRNSRIVKDSEIKVSNDRASKMFASFGSVVSSGITSKEFYDGTLTIYDALVAKYDETFNRIERAMYEKVVAEAKQIAKSNTATDNDDGGFFSNLWKKIINLFTKNDTNTALPAQIGDSVKNSYQDCPAYLFLIAEYMKNQPSISTIQSKINSLSIGNVEVTPTDNKVLISVRGDDTLALESTRQKISQALSELGLQETRMDVTGSYRAKTCVSKEDFLKGQNPLPPEKNFGGDWKADWRSTDNQSGYSDIKIYAVQQLTDSKGVEGIMLSGEGTQYFGNKITTFKVSATIIGEEITLYQYFNEIKDTVTYKGTISVDRGNGAWTNTLRSSGTWSMTRK